MLQADYLFRGSSVQEWRSCMDKEIWFMATTRKGTHVDFEHWKDQSYGFLCRLFSRKCWEVII